jgi:hypothetical protein
VRDSVVCRYLGVQGSGDYRIDWHVFRHLVQSEEVIKRPELLVEEAASQDGVHVGRTDNLLRHLDVVLWMHARRGS